MKPSKLWLNLMIIGVFNEQWSKNFCCFYLTKHMTLKGYCSADIIKTTAREWFWHKRVNFKSWFYSTRIKSNIDLYKHFKHFKSQKHLSDFMLLFCGLKRSLFYWTTYTFLQGHHNFGWNFGLKCIFSTLKIPIYYLDIFA